MPLRIQLPTTEGEFNDMMRTVDQHLRAGGIEPANRPFRAFFEISRTLKLGLEFPHPDRGPLPGVFVGPEMTIRIFRWYRENYGDRLKKQMGPGRSVLVIRDEPWIAEFPFVVGAAQMVIDTERPRATSNQQLGIREPPIVNILDLIKDFPDQARRSLTMSEIQSLGTAYLQAYHDSVALQLLGNIGMCREVATDLDASVAQIVGEAAHFGLSKWSSLQAVEKMFKTYITASGGVFKYGHELAPLAKSAEALGLAAVDPKLLLAVQCTAGIRYGQEKTDLIGAVAAHQSALRLVGALAHDMRPREASP